MPAGAMRARDGVPTSSNRRPSLVRSPQISSKHAKDTQMADTGLGDGSSTDGTAEDQAARSLVGVGRETIDRAANASEKRPGRSTNPASTPMIGRRKSSTGGTEGTTPARATGTNKIASIPMRTTSTISTASTESANTVRASAPATPAYPFPRVSGTPKFFTGSFQPFTSLSPTVPGGHISNLDGTYSEEATPVIDDAFAPSGTILRHATDPRFPTPNLYDLVLHLNSESSSGLEQWWATTVNILHDHFQADRACLSMPMDPTDIENVPWGRKATFCIDGSQERDRHRAPPSEPIISGLSDSLHSTTMLRSMGDTSPQKLHRERLRPRLDSRHSYAGHGRESRDFPGLPSSGHPMRPSGPPRTATHAAGMTSGTSSSKIQGRSSITSDVVHEDLPLTTESEGSAADSDRVPYAGVFTTLRKLDHEIWPLVEPGGINKVLERGRVVAVTRDYSSSISESASPVALPISSRASEVSRRYAGNQSFGNHPGLLASEKPSRMHRDYEEYEQQPSSPWAQSPAPSPAIQVDEEENPFFRSEEQQVSDAFSPATSPKDYSSIGQVEAIGIDDACTVIHVPLLPPSFPQDLQSFTSPPTAGRVDEASKPNITPRVERKAPMAILSIQCSDVPYPQYLMQILKLLGPHLATSLATAQQISLTSLRNVIIRHRRTASGHIVDRAPMIIEPVSLQEAVNAGLAEPPRSMSGSVTSPSEYSAHSRPSPGSSIVGTPGWDPATHGWISSRSTGNTPAYSGSEMVDNYFDARKRNNQRAGSNTSQTTARSMKKPSSSDGRVPQRRPSPSRDQDHREGGSDRRANPAATSGDEWSSPPQPPAHEPVLEEDPTVLQQSTGVTDPGRRHSQLHSHGADIYSSFGFASTASVDPRASGNSGHLRTPSHPEGMLPPTERLLRLIIDAVPVQIFTAEPETGLITWVNSKFLVYRGLNPRQVISDPWQAIHPEERQQFLAHWSRSLDRAEQLQQVVRLQRFDGDWRWFYVRAAPLRDKRHKIVHWIGTMMDFHDQHIAEINSARQQETAASEAKYRTLANSSPQIVFAANKATGVVFCNTQWLQFSGQTEAQALGVGFMDHVHPDDLIKCRIPKFDDASDQPTNVPISVPPDLSRSTSTSATSSTSTGSSETEKGASSPDSSPRLSQMPQRKLSELARKGILKTGRDAEGRPSYSTEVRLKSKDGDYRWHLVRILLSEPLLQTGYSETDIWYGTCTDINDHKTLERELKETMDEKSHFLSNMSHEIRTPLNGITGMVNFLIDSNLTAEQMEHVNIIRASTEGLRGLINDILDLSKAEAGMIQISMDWLYVRALIEEVNDLTYAMAVDKGLELNYIVAENVPAQIKGDRFRIRQILLNTVGNAIKFTAQGEVFVRCSIHEPKSGDLAKNELYIKFEVIDSGRGFSEKEAEYLFKRFSQIDGSSTRQHGGSGLGLVISRQLAQLHGGDMSAKGVPDKGSTFTFYIKATLPSKPSDQSTSLGGVTIPILPVSMTPLTTSPMSSATSASVQPLSGTESKPKIVPRFLREQSSPSPHPSPDTGKNSPSMSSASSDPSILSQVRSGSIRSQRSSTSSLLPDTAATTPPLNLILPTDKKARRSESSSSADLAKSPSSDTLPRMYSILVVCPLKYSRDATVEHINMTLPKNVPHQLTARESLGQCQELIGGENPMIFTHVVAVLQAEADIIAMINQILSSRAHQSTSIIVITDLSQRGRIMNRAPKYDYEKLASQRRLRFVFKPLKPSRFASIFDPQKEREMSTDRNQDSAQQMAVTQKQVFEEISKRLGNRDKRVLLVEDNRTNQLVVMKFLQKVSITGELVNDGVECIEKVFAHSPGYYSIILCDLHMPNKDGYQTCREIRRWERQQSHRHLPIIALSANVLGDVYQKCVDAGFNSYLTKPVDFKELSQVLFTFMDPHDPSKPHEFMKKKKRAGAVPPA